MVSRRRICVEYQDLTWSARTEREIDEWVKTNRPPLIRQCFHSLSLLLGVVNFHIQYPLGHYITFKVFQAAHSVRARAHLQRQEKTIRSTGLGFAPVSSL